MFTIGNAKCMEKIRHVVERVNGRYAIFANEIGGVTYYFARRIC